MSTCSIITFQDGKASDDIEYSNSWLGSAFIWSKLWDKYEKKNEYDNWMLAPDRLWVLAGSERLAECERVVLLGTFDRAMVVRENFQRFASDLRKFGALHPGPSHLEDWATCLETCDAEAIGFHATSCGDNLWFTYDEDHDKEIPYDLQVSSEHFEVYEKPAAKAAAAGGKDVEAG